MFVRCRSAVRCGQLYGVGQLYVFVLCRSAVRICFVPSETLLMFFITFSVYCEFFLKCSNEKEGVPFYRTFTAFTGGRRRPVRRADRFTTFMC